MFLTVFLTNSLKVKVPTTSLSRCQGLSKYLSKYPSKSLKVFQSIPNTVSKSYPNCTSSFSLTRHISNMFSGCPVEKFKGSQRPKHDTSTSIPQTKQHSSCWHDGKKQSMCSPPDSLPWNPLKVPHSFHHTAHTAAKFKRNGPRIPCCLRKPHLFRSKVPKIQMATNIETNTECQKTIFKM